MNTVDLHVHSNKSDGSFTPSELVDMAIAKGLTAFALTDHDTTAGVKEAVAYGQEKGIEVIPGIEFSTEYFPDCVITRGHYSRYLLDHGYVKSLPEAFDRYLGDHTKYFVPREKITPAQAVSLILAVKGIPVLAHPTLYHMGKDNLSSLVRHLKEAGLVALEAVYSTYSAGEERQMRQLAARYGLLISGGSDFHGKSKPGLELGTGYGKLFIPEDILIALKKKRKELFDV